MEKWVKYAGIRALKTFCQSVLAMIPVAVSVTEVNWLAVLGTSLLAAILSICTSVVTGLPEADAEVKEKTNV